MSLKITPLHLMDWLIPAPEHSLVRLMAVAPGWFGSSHAVTVAAPQEGVFYGKRSLLGSQAHCGHAPGTLGSHQSQETLRSPRLAAPTSGVPVTQPKRSHEWWWKKVESKSRWKETEHVVAHWKILSESRANILRGSQERKKILILE